MLKKILTSLAAIALSLNLAAAEAAPAAAEAAIEAAAAAAAAGAKANVATDAAAAAEEEEELAAGAEVTDATKQENKNDSKASFNWKKFGFEVNVEEKLLEEVEATKKALETAKNALKDAKNDEGIQEEALKGLENDITTAKEALNKAEKAVAKDKRSKLNFFQYYFKSTVATSVILVTTATIAIKKYLNSKKSDDEVEKEEI